MEAVQPHTKTPTRAMTHIDVSWLLAGRICVLSLALLAATFFTFFVDRFAADQVRVVYGSLLVLFVFCSVSALWLRRNEPGPVFTYLQLLADVGFVTGVVYITGGPRSPFLFLYLPPTMVAAILRSQRTALAMALLSIAAYTTLTWAMLQGILIPADGAGPIVISQTAIWLQHVGLLSAMILIGIATSFLKRRLFSSYQLVAESNREFWELVKRQESLIQAMPDGVITLANDGRVVSINAAAMGLLKLNEKEAIGKTVPQLLLHVDPTIEIGANFSEDKRGELTLQPKHLTQPIRLGSHRQMLRTSAGDPAGTIVVFQDVTKLRSIEEELELQERMARMIAESGKKTGPTYTKIESFVGESPIMQKVFKLIDKVSRSDATVLVVGESGTGKELVAKAIHLGGPRANGPFVPVNCGAIPESLIESELFGHKRGAFTDAHTDHLGLFRQAHGGTIFLDEIGELPIQMQAKLLRALQEKTVRPVGGEYDIPVDVRIVAATNKNLKTQIDKGEFREDLFYRLNVISMRLPPLRERKEDIPLLVHSILKGLMTPGKALPIVTPAAMQSLLHYGYPGNVRELENILERALVLGGDAVLPDHLPDSIRDPHKGKQEFTTEVLVDESMQFPVSLDEILSSVERRYLEVALLKTNGAKKKAAGLLGINFRSFRYRLQKYGMQEGQDGEE